MSRYSPVVAVVAKSALAKMRKRLPGAVELVYDNYNALVVGFGPSERASEAVFSIALYPRWVNLFFLNGAGLHDPHRLLKGKGKQVRSIVLESADILDRPEVEALIAAALGRATPIDANNKRKLVIRSISPVRRPRRPQK
jgi:hypothetical protein